MSDTKKLIAEARQAASDIRKYGVEFMRTKEIAADFDALADALEAVTAERDALAAVIAEALEVTRSGSVPLGMPEARHYDRLLAETRRVLTTAPAVSLAEHDAQVLETLLDDAVLMMGDNGVTVYDNREHYDRGTPAPLPIREWLRARAARRREGARS